MIVIFLFIALAVILVLWAVNTDDSLDPKKLLSRGFLSKSSPEAQKILTLHENVKILKREMLEAKNENLSLEKVKAQNLELKERYESASLKVKELTEEIERNKKWLNSQQNILKKGKGPYETL